MTNGSGPHTKAGGKKKATAKTGPGKRKPAADVLTKGLKRKPGRDTKSSGS